jgi:hypothetical protein
MTRQSDKPIRGINPIQYDDCPGDCMTTGCLRECLSRMSGTLSCTVLRGEGVCKDPALLGAKIRKPTYLRQ